MDAHGPAQHMLGYDRNKHSVPLTWNGNNFNYWDINLNKHSSRNEDMRYYRELYSASIDYLDRKISNFVDELQDRTDRETTIIVTADHGENLGYPEDEGLFNHVSSLSEALLHVPLYIINPPKGYSSEETDYFSHLSLGELVQELANNKSPNLFNNIIPAELIGGNLATRNNVPDEELGYWDRMQRCIYDDENKIVWDSLGNSDLYKIDFRHPCWQKKIQSNHTVPESARRLFGEEITEFKSDLDTSSKSIESSAKGRLDDLGYL
jgi:arylsulfatase A-like enzyme